MASTVILDYGLEIGAFLTEPIETNDQLAMDDSVAMLINTDAFAVGDSVSWSDDIALLIATPSFSVLDTMRMTDILDALLLSSTDSFSAQFNQAMQLHSLLALGYGSVIVESLTVHDSSVAALEERKALSDSDNTWLDSALPILGVQITTASLPSAVVGDVYFVQLTAVGGILPYTWSVISGSLPDGLTLTSDGIISGTPTTEGESDFTVQVLDSNGQMMLMRIRLVK